MNGTLSNERIMVPGESVTFLKVWMHWLHRLDERQAIATHRGQHDIARDCMVEYRKLESRIDTYVEALWQSNALDRAAYAAAAAQRRQG